MVLQQFEGDIDEKRHGLRSYDCDHIFPHAHSLHAGTSLEFGCTGYLGARPLKVYPKLRAYWLYRLRGPRLISEFTHGLFKHT